MPNSKEVFERAMSMITIEETYDEKRSIVNILLQYKFGITSTQTMANTFLSEFDWDKLEKLIARVNRHHPIQYIIGEQEFYGRTFKVNENVLIPRPETELLVEKTIDYLKSKKSITSVLDIGTGSGCLPITIGLELPTTKVYATDVSQRAIATAKENAARHHTIVNFIVHDVLHDELPNLKFDAIVSNPPYVLESEKKTMKENVLKYEPHSALFVPDEDPFVFYEAIARKAINHLQPNGLLALEINEQFGKKIVELLENMNYSNVQVFKDFSGKDRIVTAIYG